MGKGRVGEGKGWGEERLIKGMEEGKGKRKVVWMDNVRGDWGGKEKGRLGNTDTANLSHVWI